MTFLTVFFGIFPLGFSLGVGMLKSGFEVWVCDWIGIWILRGNFRKILKIPWKFIRFPSNLPIPSNSLIFPRMPSKFPRNSQFPCHIACSEYGLLSVAIRLFEEELEDFFLRVASYRQCWVLFSEQMQYLIFPPILSTYFPACFLLYFLFGIFPRYILPVFSWLKPRFWEPHNIDFYKWII